MSEEFLTRLRTSFPRMKSIYSFLRRKSVKANTHVNRIVFQSFKEAGVSQAGLLSVNENADSFRGISKLGFACCPDTILRFVVSVIVYTLNCVFRGWRLSHIRKESLKTIAPSIAHLDATAPVSMPKFKIRSFASSDYATPTPVNLGSAHAMGARSIADGFFVAFSALSCFASSEIRWVNRFYQSALALAYPVTGINFLKNSPHY